MEWFPDALTLVQIGVSEFHHNKLRCSNYTKIYKYDVSEGKILNLRRKISGIYLSLATTLSLQIKRAYICSNSPRMLWIRFNTVKFLKNYRAWSCLLCDASVKILYKLFLLAPAAAIQLCVLKKYTFWKNLKIAWKKFEVRVYFQQILFKIDSTNDFLM